MSLFIKKPLAQLMEQGGDSDKGLKRTLGAGNLIALGIGAIIGAGLFVRTAVARQIERQTTKPSTGQQRQDVLVHPPASRCPM